MWETISQSSSQKAICVELTSYAWNTEEMRLIRLCESSPAYTGCKYLNGVQLNICHGNSDRVATGMRRCVYGIEVAEWRRSLPLRDDFELCPVWKVSTEQLTTPIPDIASVFHL